MERLTIRTPKGAALKMNDTYLIEILESQNIGGFSFIVTPGMTYEECVERIPNFPQLFPYFQIWQENCTMCDQYVVVTNDRDNTLDLLKCSTREQGIAYVLEDFSNEMSAAQEAGADCSITERDFPDDWCMSLETRLDIDGEYEYNTYTWHVCQAMDLDGEY